LRIPEHDDRDRAAGQILLVAHVLVRGDLLAGAGALTTLGGDYVSLPEPAACFR